MPEHGTKENEQRDICAARKAHLVISAVVDARGAPGRPMWMRRSWTGTERGRHLLRRHQCHHGGGTGGREGVLEGA
eukprot:2149180-Pyramimonas_sp.AAC.1